MKKIINNKFIKHSIWVSLVIIILVMFDLIMKSYLFKYPGEDTLGPVQDNLKFIGIRSYAHTNSTIFSFLNWSINQSWRVAISVFLGLVLSIISLFQKNLKNSIFIGIIIAGIFGNGFDNAFFGYVRDILFTPWWDRGTFNFADILVVVGAILFAFSQLVDLLKKDKTSI